MTSQRLYQPTNDPLLLCFKFSPYEGVSTRQGVRIAFELNAEEFCLRFIVKSCQVVTLHSEPRARISILFSYILCDVILII